jgi:hypothetical protein
MAVWGVWLDGSFLFSTGSRSRKARNLRSNPVCVVALNDGDVTVTLEGRATRLSDGRLRSRCEAAYDAKYPEGIPAGEPVFRVEPEVVFGIGEPPFTATATRWDFSRRRHL